MAFTKKNEEAVSPVIGVILMVAITVILAAVIAAFVFGMAGNISKTKIVAMTVQKISSSDIAVRNMGGQDAGSLLGVNITVPGAATAEPHVGTDTTIGNMAGNPVAVGCVTHMYSDGAFTGKNQVTVVGWFNDGNQQVLLDTVV
ncbi:MAG: type IV pilin N-terminal domain-containing protein [Methanoregula sp.]|nr:type IV pilin N-terminal domain-containing protein [Methanoregula sp.]